MKGSISSGLSPHVFTPEKAKEFLEMYRESGNVTKCARALGFDRATIYYHLGIDKAFKRKFKEFRKESSEVLEAEARRRAVEGVEKPVIHQGQPQGVWVNDDGQMVPPETPGATLKLFTVREYSDTLLIFLLKANDPDKFRENIHHDHAHKGTVGVEMTWADMFKRPEKLPDPLAERLAGLNGTNGVNGGGSTNGARGSGPSG